MLTGVPGASSSSIANVKVDKPVGNGDVDELNTALFKSDINPDVDVSQYISNTDSTGAVS